MTMPAFFIAHGAPLLALENNEYTQAIQQLREEFPRPKAIVLFSAHWEAPVQMVSNANDYDTIHDFGGFPDELHRMQYPAHGDPALAEDITQLFDHYHIDYSVNSQRGLDHGAWVVLNILYPDADIPVISMSVNPHLSPADQYHIGRALASLREQDIMVIGSGGTVHNLMMARMDLDDDIVDSWVPEFEAWLNEKVKNWDTEALFDYEQQAPHASKAVPPFGKEHFIPLFYAMGAADNNKTAMLRHQSYRYRNLSHTIWQFG
ncbi:4,5-DOPA dioxygenase extradiol [Alteribacillus persepolensis]|uniref:4,5-DOPA dioxygenase extradiol n=1 Tax=Alteribacillus persepolensis TaxID=568899 RepID=A0A1G8B2F3_9BACI|nr:class III extradiol ring-cleavage dioxygenase [Alteribacillus persepolensis]SDH27439.1 4,5-DOPA dioxygenase extradiol [Alteribacillus persepolensis]